MAQRTKLMRYLVSGGAGFIGSHIVERLLTDGYTVRVLDNFYSGKRQNLRFAEGDKRFQLLEGDIRSPEVCAVATKDIDAVLHQAALRSVPKSLDDPYSFNDVNITGTLNLLRASLANKVQSFVFASSSSIYGETAKFPEQEDDLPKLISPYALTKLTGEYYCRIFSQNYGLPTRCLRYFNVFGPRQSLDDEYAVVVPKFITTMLRDEQPPIHGNGKQSRDFTYIDNVVEANILAVSSANVPWGVFNIANGKDYSILELAALLNKIMGKSVKPIFTPPRQGDVAKTLADITQAKNILGFKPRIDFEAGLRFTVKWFQEKH